MHQATYGLNAALMRREELCKGQRGGRAFEQARDAGRGDGSKLQRAGLESLLCIIIGLCLVNRVGEERFP